MRSVFGIGNPLMDLVARVDYRFLEGLGVQTGTMNLVSAEERNEILQNVNVINKISGGSCANTIRGISWIGAESDIPAPVYCGAVGSDSLGEDFINCLERLGIQSSVSKKHSPTGVSIVTITPDLERTMFTFLGACRKLIAEDVDLELLRQSRILHITGYMWDTENQMLATKRSVSFAQKHDLLVSFDLADPLLVSRNREDFLSWIPGRVDLLLGNQEEFAILLGECGENLSLIREASALAKLVVMKNGPEGCYVTAGNSKIEKIDGKVVRAVDTTGAGDAFGAGFLHGIMTGRDPVEAARIACTIGAHIVTVEGCDFSLLDWDDLKKELKE